MQPLGKMLSCAAAIENPPRQKKKLPRAMLQNFILVMIVSSPRFFHIQAVVGHPSAVNLAAFIAGDRA
jgi:hypothetical protein